MKAVILAGGFGTRFSEESQFKPKPMIEIGNMPILWHILKCYSHYNINEFVICAGYKQDMIKKWFSDYFLYTSDVTFDFTKEATEDRIIIHNRKAEPWKVTVVDTGPTLTSVTLQQQKGILDIGGDNAVHAFREKNASDGASINAGFMVMEPGVFDYIAGDQTVFEREPLERLAAEGQLMSYAHHGFWQCMDTKREHDLLQKLWTSGNAPWKVWD